MTIDSFGEYLPLVKLVIGAEVGGGGVVNANRDNRNTSDTFTIAIL